MTAFTVTATQTGAGADIGMVLSVRVLTGAAATQNGASASVSGSSLSPPSLAITPHASGSLVFGAQILYPGNTTYTPLSSTTYYINSSDASEGFGTYVSSSATTASTPVTLGGSAPTGGTAGGFAQAEVLASGTLAVDASSPADVAWASVGALTTAAFTPPAGSLLVAMTACNGGGGVETMSITDTSGLGLTWTALSQANTSGEGYAGVWVAVVPGGAVATTHKSLAFSTGRTSWNLGAPVQNPQPGPVFVQKNPAIQAKLPSQGQQLQRPGLINASLIPTFPVTHVGDSSVVSGAGSASQSVTYSSTSGNTLVAYLSGYMSGNNPISVTSVTDNTGTNVWTVIPGIGSYDGSTFFATSAIAFCVNAAPVTSVTVNWSTTPTTNGWIQVSEFHGIPATATLDASSNTITPGSYSSFANPTAATTSTADLVLGVCSSGAGFSTVKPGSLVMSGLAAWNIATTYGSRSFTFSGGSTPVYSAITAGIKIPVPAAAPYFATGRTMWSAGAPVQNPPAGGTGRPRLEPGGALIRAERPHAPGE